MAFLEAMVDAALSARVASLAARAEADLAALQSEHDEHVRSTMTAPPKHLVEKMIAARNRLAMLRRIRGRT